MAVIEWIKIFRKPDNRLDVQVSGVRSDGKKYLSYAVNLRKDQVGSHLQGEVDEASANQENAKVLKRSRDLSEQ